MRKVFLPERVQRVDEVAGNVLIRGPMPLAGESWHYAYEEIAEAAGISLQGYDYASVSLIDCVGERDMLEAEFQAFGLEAPPSSYWPPYLRTDYAPSKPMPGIIETDESMVPASLYWWPIEGLPEGVNPAECLSYPGWDFSGISDLVHGLMSERRPRPLALYVHCTLGADRTGALHTGYLVKKGVPLDEAIRQADSSTPAGAPNEDYRRLRAAYAASIGR